MSNSVTHEAAAKTAIAAAMAVVGNYIDGFNARDAEKMADAFNFPHVRLAKGNFITIDNATTLIASQQKVTHLLRDEGWTHTVIESMHAVQSNHEKVHLAIHFTRRAADEAVLHAFDTLWIVTCSTDVSGANPHWGVQFRSSYLVSNASTLGNSTPS